MTSGWTRNPAEPSIGRGLSFLIDGLNGLIRRRIAAIQGAELADGSRLSDASRQSLQEQSSIRTVKCRRKDV